MASVTGMDNWSGGLSPCGCGGCGTLDCGMEGFSSSGGAFSNCNILSICPYPKPPDCSSSFSHFKSSLNVQVMKVGKLLGTIRPLYEGLSHHLPWMSHPHPLFVSGYQLLLLGHVVLLQPALVGVVVLFQMGSCSIRSLTERAVLVPGFLPIDSVRLYLCMFVALVRSHIPISLVVVNLLCFVGTELRSFVGDRVLLNSSSVRCSMLFDMKSARHRRRSSLRLLRLESFVGNGVRWDRE
nr:hypothetical protein Iba_chr10cCG9330 [Ipomoea batatas]